MNQNRTKSKETGKTTEIEKSNVQSSVELQKESTPIIPTKIRKPPSKSIANKITPFQQFQLFRDEDKHECNLISARINALLTSQSLLLAGALVLYSEFKTLGKEQIFIVIVIAVLGLITSLLSGIAIFGGCKVLRAWHKYSKKIQGLEQLEDSVVRTRNMPDVWHIVGMEVFSIGMPIVFVVFWITVLIFIYRPNLFISKFFSE